MHKYYEQESRGRATHSNTKGFAALIAILAGLALAGCGGGHPAHSQRLTADDLPMLYSAWGPGNGGVTATQNSDGVIVNVPSSFVPPADFPGSAAYISMCVDVQQDEVYAGTAGSDIQYVRVVKDGVLMARTSSGSGCETP